MKTARPANDNLEFGFSTFTDKFGRPYPNDAFENDIGHYDGPPRMDLDETTKKINERIEKIPAERSPS